MPCRYFFWLSYTTFALFRAPVLLQKLVEVDFFLHFVLQRLYVSIYIVKWVIFSDMHGFTSSWLLTFRSKMAKRKAMPTLCPFRGQYQVSLENTHCQFAKIFEELPQCKVHSFLKLLFKSIFTKIIYMNKYWLCLKATLIILAPMRRNIGLRIASGNIFNPIGADITHVSRKHSEHSFVLWRRKSNIKQGLL